MLARKETLITKHILLFILFCVLVLSTKAFAEQQEMSKESTTWLDQIFGTFPKYSPADEEIPYYVLPPWLDSWKNFKKDMEEQYGTSIGIVLDDHHQQIL